MVCFEPARLEKHDVPTADEFGKLGAVFGRAQALIDFADGFDAVEVVSVVFRQDIGQVFLPLPKSCNKAA